MNHKDIRPLPWGPWWRQMCAQPAARLTWLLAATCLLLGLGVEAWRWWTSPALHPHAELTEASTGGRITLNKRSASLIGMPEGVPSAHASALAVLPGDEMLAFWWAGTRESGPDVEVFVSRWAQGQWGPPRSVVQRAALSRALGFGVRRLGNPTAWAARDGTIHLYVVATGLGGWAASRIVHLASSDGATTFDVRRVLPLSPLFNTSMLVRTNPVGLVDGGWWLPAHFEIGNKYPLVMSFDSQGDPRWVTRIGSSTTTLQPAIVPVSGTEVRAWMRDISEQQRVQHAVSRDGGASWEDLPAVNIPNHDNSVAALRLRDGGFVLLHNDRVSEGGSPRSVLRMLVSDDAGTWANDIDVVRGEPGDEFSYPSVLQVGDELHVTYTSRRQAIAHHVYQIDYQKVLK